MTDQDSSSAYDADFKLRERHPNFQDYFDRNDALSETIRRDFDHDCELAYGPHPLQRVDVVPSSQPRSPVFVFIHGGFWRCLDKRSYHFTARPFLERGFVAAHVNYRLAPEVSMREIVNDVLESIDWIRKNVEHYNGDPKALHVAGHSAGAHLALMAAILQESDSHPQRYPLRSVLCVSGLFDLEPVTQSYLQPELAFDRSTVLDYSPLKRKDLTMTPPVSFAVGGEETDAFLRQSEDMHQRFAASGHQSSHWVLPQLNHFDIVYELGEPKGAIARRALEMMVKK